MTMSFNEFHLITNFIFNEFHLITVSLDAFVRNKLEKIWGQSVLYTINSIGEFITLNHKSRGQGAQPSLIEVSGPNEIGSHFVTHSRLELQVVLSRISRINYILLLSFLRWIKNVLLIRSWFTYFCGYQTLTARLRLESFETV